MTIVQPALPIKFLGSHSLILFPTMMKSISDKQLRRQLSNLLHEGQKILPKDPKLKLTLEGIDSMLKFFDGPRKEARKTSAQEFERQLSLSYLMLLTFSLMALGIDLKKRESQPIDPHWLGTKSPDPNFIFRGMLVQIVNYSLAVVRLIEDGLDNPARSVLRTVNELTCQTIVLLADKSQMLEYATADNPHDAKRVWYTLFAKKGRLKKNLTKLEKQLGLPDKFLPDLTEFRNEMDLNLSESVHHSFVSTVIRSYSSSGLNKVELALAGRLGMSSRQTLEGLIDMLVYTLHMIVHILVDIHSFKFPTKDPFWKATGILSVSISKISGVWNDETELKEHVS